MWRRRDRRPPHAGRAHPKHCVRSHGKLPPKCLGIWRDLDERRHVAFSTIGLGVCAGFRGDFEQARDCLYESLSTFTELDDDRGVIWSLAMYARVLAAEAHPKRAVCLLNATLALAIHRSVAKRPPDVVPFWGCLERYQRSACVAFGAGIVAAAVAEGQAMSLEQAMAYARNQSS